LESELAQGAGDQHIADGGLPSIVVPESLFESFAARLDRLGPAKKVAQTGAVIGREFSHRLLAASGSEE
jgi:predicted ATPase